MPESSKFCKPFVRWAGGKTWIIKYLDEIIGDMNFVRYHEPFIGGGAVFFSLGDIEKAYISDINSELIKTYLAIKNDPEKVIEELGKHENTEEYYYKLRDQENKDEIQNAARFIFLNQTSFNGLYRVNKDGRYNVPYGFRKNVNISEENIFAVSNKLKTAKIECKDFSAIKDDIKKGDVVFLDPPYTVSHNDNGFIEYNKNLFSLDDQIRLRDLIQEIKKKEAFYILTNAAHERIYEIFNIGDRLIEMKRKSLIGGKNAKRGEITEYVFTNIKLEVIK